MQRKFLIISSVSGLLCVALGAFGAHSLKAWLPADQYAIYEKAVSYQFYHTFSLMAVSFFLSKGENTFLKIACYCFTTGIILFSGSLYLLSIRSLIGSEMQWLGPVTPLGGLLFMAGWFMLLAYAVKNKT